MPAFAAQGFITQPECHCARRFDLFAREQQIQIVLRAKTRICHETRSVCEAFQRNELQPGGSERIPGLPKGHLRSPPAFRVVREISMETIRNPGRQMIAATKQEWNRQLGAVAEVDKL